MSEPIRVRYSYPGELARGLAGIPPAQLITAVFRDPETGADLPVTISAFQGAGCFGVGVYRPAAPDGEPVQGVIVRWDAGPQPAVIRWDRPLDGDDECGNPRARRGRRRR